MANITKSRSLLPFGAFRTDLGSLFGEMNWPYNEENGGFMSSMWRPLTDISETKKEFMVKMDLPGVHREDVVVNVEDGQLTISGKRAEEKKEEDENFIRLERLSGSFHRLIPLPKAVKADAIKAEFRNGELFVHIPKTEESIPRRIKIE